MKHLAPLLLSAALVLSPASLGASAKLDSVRKSFDKAMTSSYSPSEDVTDNFIRYSENGEASIDVLLMQLYLSVQLPDAEMERVLGLFDMARGTWKDINYQDMARGGWHVTLHATRLYSLAKSYACPDSKWYKNERLGETLHSAAQWWFRTMPVNPNWWHNDIGVPRKLGAAMLLLRDELSPEEMEGTLKVFEKSRFGMTGQNKTSLAGNQLMKGLLIDDDDLVQKAREQIAEEIFVTASEGIQSDWSFHQHGPQMQWGNYGLAFAENVSFWIRVLDGTPFAFSDEKVEIMENFILEGLSWTIWNGFMDPSACGRQLHINGCRGKAYSFAVAAQNMAALNRPHREKFAEIAAQNLQPEKYSNRLVGAHYFPRSEYGVYRASDWFASIRMCSSRTIGFEYTNQENLLANFSADAALLLMRSSREYENIFPFWDWRMIPGVTSYDDGKPIPFIFRPEKRPNLSALTDGWSEGERMVTTMEVSRDGLHAFKTNFFLGDCIICLGADVRTSNPEVKRLTTALEQNHLVGKPVAGCCGNNGWINHSKTGYVSLDGAELCLSCDEQSGNWSNMAPIYNRVDSGKVFKCWVEHDPKAVGSYAYAILPGFSVAKTKSFARAFARGRKTVPGVVANDAAVQAVAFDGKLYVVAHQAGEYELEGRRIAFEEAGIRVIPLT